jgi:hypothetical protein
MIDRGIMVVFVGLATRSVPIAEPESRTCLAAGVAEVGDNLGGLGVLGERIQLQLFPQFVQLPENERRRTLHGIPQHRGPTRRSRDV